MRNGQETKQERREKLFYITRRMNTTTKFKVLIRAISIVTALLVCAIVFSLFSPGNFGNFFVESFSASTSTINKTFNTIEEFTLLLGISIAVLPAFKMKYWNLGAEGQVLMGALAAGIISKFVGPNVPEAVSFILMPIGGIIGGLIWAAGPALCKAYFNTNETLFTLMMNYIASGFVLFFSFLWDPAHGRFAGLEAGMFPYLPDLPFLPYIISFAIIALVFAAIYVYLKFTKHGYELSVVGESRNTAHYIGINNRRVVIRTALLSGALCGIVGWLFVVGQNGSVSDTMVNGRGFTAVLIAWLGHFDCFEIALMAFLVAFISRGSSQAGTNYNLGNAFNKICIAVFLFTILAFEFFLNYKINFNHKNPLVQKFVRKENN